MRMKGSNKCYAYKAAYHIISKILMFSRHYLQIYGVKSTYNSYKFLLEVIKRFPFKIYTVRTDNGLEFTKRLIAKDENSLTIFEHGLAKADIRHDLIKPYTPNKMVRLKKVIRKIMNGFILLAAFIQLMWFVIILTS